jgi:hypothetical protein
VEVETPRRGVSTRRILISAKLRFVAGVFCFCFPEEKPLACNPNRVFIETTKLSNSAQFKKHMVQVTNLNLRQLQEFFVFVFPRRSLWLVIQTVYL